MVVWVAGRTAAHIDAVAGESQIGGHALAGDVSQEDDVARWFQEVGPVDLLVNSAGLQGPLMSFEQEEPESWRGSRSTSAVCSSAAASLFRGLLEPALAGVSIRPAERTGCEVPQIASFPFSVQPVLAPHAPKMVQAWNRLGATVGIPG
jgi:NAD(P)-dependent dehydrogenase (short-subunit alcohol dehydrogenase family)